MVDPDGLVGQRLAQVRPDPRGADAAAGRGGVAGARRGLDDGGRHPGTAVAVTAPGCHARRRRALGLPLGPAGAAAAHRLLPGHHHLLRAARSRGGHRGSAAGPSLRVGGDAGGSPLPRRRRRPAGLGACHRGRQLPGVVPALRPPPAPPQHGPRPEPACAARRRSCAPRNRRDDERGGNRRQCRRGSERRGSAQRHRRRSVRRSGTGRGRDSAGRTARPLRGGNGHGGRAHGARRATAQPCRTSGCH